MSNRKPRKYLQPVPDDESKIIRYLKSLMYINVRFLPIWIYF